jgi:hypothetical protein
MSYLTGSLPVAQGVAVFASLKAAAEAHTAQGDERSRDQIMADLLVQRVTGQAEAELVPVKVSVVMTDQALFNTGGGASEPVHLDGFGPVPAELIRRLLLAGDAAAGVWVRRIYANPATGELASIDARRRLFEGSGARLLIARDQWCRTRGATLRSGTQTTWSRSPRAGPPARGRHSGTTTSRSSRRPGTANRSRSPDPHG